MYMYVCMLNVTRSQRFKMHWACPSKFSN